MDFLREWESLMLYSCKLFQLTNIFYFTSKLFILDIIIIDLQYLFQLSEFRSLIFHESLIQVQVNSRMSQESGKITVILQSGKL